jgi:hypothetical protein
MSQRTLGRRRGKTPFEVWEDDHQSGNALLRTIARIARRQDDQKGCVNG